MFNSNQTDPNQHLGLLPSGWEMIFDHKTGWPYFVDHNTHTTSWEDPRLNPGFKANFPTQQGGHYPTMPSDQSKMREIPVMHESSRQGNPPPQPPQHQPQHPGAQPQHPGAQWQQYPQSRTPPRTSTPPRVSTPPRTEGTTPRFYTLPRNHKDRAQDPVREIPIQHFSSRPMSPGRQGNQQQPMPSVPHPDYPGAQQGQQDRFMSSTLPRATGQAQMYPQAYPAASQGYPQPQGQGYPQSQGPQSYPSAPSVSQHQGYPQAPSVSQHQGYPQAPPVSQNQGPQGYPQAPQGYPQAPPVSQQQPGYPQPPPVSHHQGYQQRQGGPQSQAPPMPQPQGPQVSQQGPYPAQQPHLHQAQGHQPSPPPASQPQCRPPESQQEVYNIPIIRETQKGPQPPSQQPRQYTPDRQQGTPGRGTPDNQYGNTRPSEGTRTREGSYDQPDHGMAGQHTNSGQNQQQMPSNQNHSEPPKNQPRTPLEDISDILEGCKQYEERVLMFSGTKKDKEYKLLEEMMTRGILKLDGIESGSNDAIRQARKGAVREIQSYLDQLELKAFSQAQAAKDNRNSNGATSGTSEAESMDAQSSGGESSDKSNSAKVKEMVLGSEVSC